jgi:hypothetical protein
VTSVVPEVSVAHRGDGPVELHVGTVLGRARCRGVENVEHGLSGLSGLELYRFGSRPDECVLDQVGDGERAFDAVLASLSGGSEAELLGEDCRFTFGEADQFFEFSVDVEDDLHRANERTSTAVER